MLWKNQLFCYSIIQLWAGRLGLDWTFVASHSSTAEILLVSLRTR